MESASLIQSRSEALHVVEFNTGVDLIEPRAKTLHSDKERSPTAKAPAAWRRQRQPTPMGQSKKAKALAIAPLQGLAPEASGLSKKMRKPATNTLELPAPQHPQSILVKYKQSHNVFAGLSKKMRKPLARKDKNMQTTQNAISTKAAVRPVDVLRAPVTTLTTANLEEHSASISAATKDNLIASKASLAGTQLQGKHRAEDQEKEGPVPQKTQDHTLGRLRTRYPIAKPRVLQRKPLLQLPLLPTRLSREEKANANFEKGPSSENVKSSAPENIPANPTLKSTAKAVFAKAKDPSEPAPVAGRKRKLETAKDVKTSAGTEVKKQRLSGLRQTANLYNSRPWVLTRKR